MLLGGISAGALSGCGPQNQSPPITTQNVYTNNFQVPGIGFYHAPFRAWYSLPYNHYDANTRRYFYGGQWGEQPHHSITNISAPLPEVASQAQAQRTDIVRSGWGSSSTHSHIYS